MTPYAGHITPPSHRRRRKRFDAPWSVRCVACGERITAFNCLAFVDGSEPFWPPLDDEFRFGRALPKLVEKPSDLQWKTRHGDGVFCMNCCARERPSTFCALFVNGFPHELVWGDRRSHFLPRIAA